MVRQTFRRQGYCAGRPKGASQYQLSLGKIVDTLQADYPAVFDRSPNFDIYDDCVVFELGSGTAFDGRQMSTLQGKRAYCRAILALQGLANRTVREGKVKCSVQQGSTCGYTLRVNWTCHGEIAIWRRQPLYISAISVYSVAPEASLSGNLPFPLHRIDRHKIEFVEIHPPSLRTLLLGAWWVPQVKMEPSLALQGNQADALFASRAADGALTGSPTNLPY